MDELLARTLTEIEDHDWGEPQFPSHLVTKVHALRYKPIGEFTVEDLRISIGQSVGLPFLIPLALTQLESDPLVSGDDYHGDLLASVLKIDDSFWSSNDPLRARMLAIAESVPIRCDDSQLVESCSAYASKWRP